MSVFLARPHIANADGTVITPDILIDRLVRFSRGSVRTRITGSLTHDVWVQVVGPSVRAAPACLLLAAGAGTTVLPAIELGDGRVALARKAWRLRQLGDGGRAVALAGSDWEAPLAAFAPPEQAIAAIEGSQGHSLPRGIAVLCPLEQRAEVVAPGSRVSVRLVDRAGDRSLEHWIDLKDADADHWDKRPQPEYSEGPQFREVTHYV